MSILFSIVAIPIYIPSNSVGRFSSPYTLSKIYCLWIYFVLRIKIVGHQEEKEDDCGYHVLVTQLCSLHTVAVL